MHRSEWMMVGVVFAALAYCAPAAAQIYRCGQTYQDRPCDSGQQGKTIRGSAAPQSSVKPVADAECAQRGVDSQKIMWARQAGAMAERQLAEAKSGSERKLIADVYRKRGSVPEVQAAIEADCVADKEKIAQAAALAAAAAQLAGQNRPVEAPAPGEPSAVAMKAPDARREDEEATPGAKRKKARCDDLKARLEQVRRSQRAGASAEGMDSLNQQRRDIEKTRHREGC